MDRLSNEFAHKIMNGGLEQAEICPGASCWLTGDVESLCISSGQ